MVSLAVEYFGYAHIDTQFVHDHKIDLEAHAKNNHLFLTEGMACHTLSKKRPNILSWEELQNLPMGETKPALKQLKKELKKMPAKFGFK